MSSRRSEITKAVKESKTDSAVRLGSLEKMFKNFIDDDGKPLTRDDIISMVEYLAQSEPPTDDLLKQGIMTRWLNHYNVNPSKDTIRYENICTLAGVSADEFYGRISRLYDYLNKEGAIKRLRGALPSVVKKTIEFAKREEGVRDRELILKMNEMAGMQPAGTNINLNQSVNVSSLQAAGVPHFETEQAKHTTSVLSQIHRRVLGPAPSNPASIPVIRESENDAITVEVAEVVESDGKDAA